MNLLKKHWEKVYESIPTDQLGWFEESPQPSIDLLQQCHLDKDARILNVGVGTSYLIDYLVEQGFTQVIATDISAEALDQLKNRLGKKQEAIQWIVDDLTQPDQLKTLEPVDLWHDRAVLHFFTDEEDQKAYFNLLQKVVKPEGFVIIAVFSLTGAKKCSELPIKNYNVEMLQKQLGNVFQIQKKFDYLYTTPSADSRDYIYTLFKRIL